MSKKVVSIAIMSVLVLCVFSLFALAADLVAAPTASTVLVNGENVAFDAYNINDNNYFKLRDLAYVLNGTAKQFEVGWDNANNAIMLTSGKAYTPAGGEMAGKGAGNKTPVSTTSKIYLDGTEAQFTAYNIEDNNYFKLRDIGQAFDFGVDWDGANNTIAIDTSKGYTREWKTATTDWMQIDIPAAWSWSYTDDHPDDIYITSDDASISIFVGYLIAGDPDAFLAENPSQPFTFSSGTVGYVLEFDDRIMWLNPDMFLGSGVCFYFEDGKSAYTNNEDVIIKIAGSYRSNQ